MAAFVNSVYLLFSFVFNFVDNLHHMVEHWEVDSHNSSVSGDDSRVNERHSISFWKAFALPRVALYASCFFCTKMAVYCLLLWLPTFLKGDPQL